VDPPIVSGSIPPPAVAHITRSETGVSLVGLPPGVTVALVPAEAAAPAGQAGLGGTGKTCLAAAAARRLGRDAALHLVVWVTATSRDAVVSSYAQALCDMGMRVPAASLERAAAQFVAWLERADRPWLVVLDDLRDRSVLDGLWPRGPAGWVLITTQRPDSTFEVDNRHLVRVGPFSPREALACLTVREYTDASQRTGALDLASALEFHPVALGQAVGVMTALEIGCGEYRSRLDEHAHRTAVLPIAGRAPALAATWSASVEAADLLPPAGLAGRALALLSMLAPHGIPRAALTSDAACEYVTGRADGSTTRRAESTAAFSNLARAGLVSIDPDSAACTVLVHPLVQAIAHEQLLATEGESAALAAAAALNQAWSQPDLPPLVAQRLRDCTAHLHRLAGSLLWAADCHPALLHAGRSLEGGGMDGLAADYWRTMLAISQPALGARHPRTLMIRGRFAAACEASGLLPEAIAIYEETLTELEQTLPPVTRISVRPGSTWRTATVRPAATPTRSGWHTKLSSTSTT
jgi:hypothetical protein